MDLFFLKELHGGFTLWHSIGDTWVLRNEFDLYRLAYIFDGISNLSFGRIILCCVVLKS